MKCPECGSLVEPAATHCWKCGQDPRGKVPTRAARRKAARGAGRRSRPKSDSAIQRPGNRSTVILIVGLLVLGLATAGYLSIHFDWFGLRGTAKVTHYGEGKGGVEYTSSAGGFTATYPTRPTDFDKNQVIRYAGNQSSARKPGFGAPGVTVAANEEQIQVRGAESQPGTDYRFVALTTDVTDTGSLQFLSNEDAFVEFAKEFALGGNGEIVGLSQDPLVIAGTPYPGVSARIVNGGNSVYVRGLIVGTTWYVLLMTEPTKKDNPDAFKRFVESFRLTP